jgi:hypothetical protein
LLESRGIREALAQPLGLDEKADYCAVVDDLLARADRFLADVERQPIIGRVKWGPVSLTDFAY